LEDVLSVIGFVFSWAGVVTGDPPVSTWASELAILRRVLLPAVPPSRMLLIPSNCLRGPLLRSLPPGPVGGAIGRLCDDEEW
jgi:hypothetical protein